MQIRSGFWEYHDLRRTHILTGTIFSVEHGQSIASKADQMKGHIRSRAQCKQKSAVLFGRMVCVGESERVRLSVLGVSKVTSAPHVKL